jgi:predicted cupin superfamily sugar epimerase
MTVVNQTRADELISALQLMPHPEGGFYRETYRSPSAVQSLSPLELRSAVTTIFFLLKAGQFSRLHQVTSDEIWHFYEGSPIELTWGALDGTPCERRLLGPVAADQTPVLVVPANAWQAARSTGAYTLVGCTVAPGFEFQYFRMLNGLPDEAERVRTLYPDLASII